MVLQIQTGPDCSEAEKACALVIVDHETRRHTADMMMVMFSAPGILLILVTGGVILRRAAPGIGVGLCGGGVADRYGFNTIRVFANRMMMMGTMRDGTTDRTGEHADDQKQCQNDSHEG